MRVIVLLLALSTFQGGIATADEMIREVRQPPRYEWKKFVKVAGQPNEVPAEWVSTPEGKFAHSIVIPNPVPADSGYRPWWSAKQYHKHLCETEAGEFIFKTVDNVEGLLFMRPPIGPTDYDMKDARKLEAPLLETNYQGRSHIRDRGRRFASDGKYGYVEEPAHASDRQQEGFFRAFGPPEGKDFWLRMVHVEHSTSTFGITWRGVIRRSDRENAIAGYEVLVVDLKSGKVMGVLRDFGITGGTRGTRDGIWWLNARQCPAFSKRYKNSNFKHLYDFTSAVLRPSHQ